MGFYDKYVLPRFLNAACGTKPIVKQREKVVPACTGRVLERLRLDEEDRVVVTNQ